MDAKETSLVLIDFIEKSPSAFHTIASLRSRLDKNGFEFMPETSAWAVQPGSTFYTTRNDSSLVAVRVGKNVTANACQFMMTAAHSDSPTYKIKANAELEGPGDYIRLNVEAYGAMIDSTWLDRPLGLAGRVVKRTENGLQSILLHVEKDVLLIPNLAIHMNHDVNKGYEFNRQVDLCPLFSAGKLQKGAFAKMLAQELDIDAGDIVGYELNLVNREKAKVWGWADEFVSAPRLDDLQCAFAASAAFCDSENDDVIKVFACFDNEEVGSQSKQGALSTLLKDTLKRVVFALGGSEQDYFASIARSFMVSCDNAHAVHPNHPEKADDENRAYLNKGVVIKEAANQKYTTDAISRAIFSEICKRADVPTQVFANRSNMQGGSTLGNLSNSQVSVCSLDIGLPQLAMHSSYETAGVQDTAWAISALRAFYETHLLFDDGGAVRIIQ